MDAREAFLIAGKHVDDAELDALFGALLRVPSVHTELMEADPAVKAFAADVVAPSLEGLTGVAPRVDGMGNLLWRCGGPGSDAAEGLLFMGYAMTYPAGSMPEAFSAKVVPGEDYGLSGPCLWGRGGCEQKAALAAMMAGAAAVCRSGLALARPLSLAVSLAGETGRHHAARHMLEEDGLTARYGIVGLGTTNRVCLGNKGRIDVDVVVRGKSCHSSTPWAGVNAVDGARAVLERLDGLVDGIAHPELGPASLVATHIESGPDILHTIQDHCRLTLDRRLMPGEEPGEALAAISRALADMEPWRVEVTQGNFMYPADVPASSEVAGALEAARGQAGEAGPPLYFPAALDAGYLNEKGIETVMFGPGDLAFAHTDAEVVPLGQVRRAARVYAAAALQLLA
ncbi:MAG: M20/M25/M40 family metallo-hydrolase [Deltaproteobacteria bacterium]|nr:M20/M25/M40 family metallo-hydrolase [Deltaproteobacteria bacterium]